MISRRTIAHLNHEQMAGAPDAPAYYHLAGDRWVATTNRAVLGQAAEISLGLADLGVGHGDRVAVMSESRPDWAICDAAVLDVGAAVVSIYPTSTPDATRFILEHSGASVGFVETAAHARMITSQRSSLPDLRAIVVFEPGAPDETMELSDLRGRGAELLAADPDRLAASRDSVHPQDMASLMYTSGTTGPPKGVPLTHGMLFDVVETIVALVDVEAGDTGVVYLPMSHILERVNVYVGRYVGMSGYFAPAITELVATCRAAHPRTVAGVPRVYEKIHAAIMAGVQQASPARQRLFHRAIDVGRRRVQLEQAGSPVPVGVRVQHALFERLVYSKLRSGIFGSNIEFLSSGAAPISVELLEFFYAIGLPVYEGYGLTETSSPITYNHKTRHRIGTVGPPIPGADVRIAEDGEILLRGPSVFEGYFRDAEATAAAFTDDGWFMSGDIGHLDDEGFLRVTDRKKALIITAAGKNIAPAPIEQLLLQHPLAGQVVVHGDRRKYLTALISLDPDATAAWAARAGKPPEWDPAGDPDVGRELADFVEQVNGRLGRFETIKHFRVVPEEFSVENGLLTPSMKIKRRVVEAHYRTLLDEMYDPADAGPDG